MRLFVYLFIGLFLNMCAQDPGAYNNTPETEASYSVDQEDYETIEEEDYEQEENTGEAVATQNVSVERKIIRTADLSMEVENYDKGVQAVREIIKKRNAYIASETENRWDYRIQNQYAIKLPPAQLDGFIADLEAIAFEIPNKSVSAKDVTREYIDLEIRLNAKREIADRYQNILQSAKSVKDILEIEEKLRYVIEEIESTEGQLRYLKNQVKWSTLNLTLFESIEVAPTKGRSFIKRLGSSIKTGWKVLQDLILGIVSIWPIVIIGIGIAYYFLRRRKQKKA